MIDVSQVTAENYHQYAIHTESTGRLELLTSRSVIAHLSTLLEQSQVLGYQFDLFKKHLFYGAQTVGFDRTDDLDQNSKDVYSRICADPRLLRLIHAFAGMQSELAEMADILQSVLFDGAALDEVNAQEEAGDMNWYLNGLWAAALGTSAASLMQQNIAKLAVRYPDRFTEFNANNRDLETERKVLEAHGEAPVQLNTGDGMIFAAKPNMTALEKQLLVKLNTVPTSKNHKKLLNAECDALRKKIALEQTAAPEPPSEAK